jgi:hypothetical protein
VKPRRTFVRRDGKGTVYPLDIQKRGFKLIAFADRDAFLSANEPTGQSPASSRLGANE